MNEEGTEDGPETLKGLNQAVSEDGRYWARTSDPQLTTTGTGTQPYDTGWRLRPSGRTCFAGSAWSSVAAQLLAAAPVLLLTFYRLLAPRQAPARPAPQPPAPALAAGHL